MTSSALAEVARMIHRECGIVLKPAQLPSLEDAIARVERGLTAERLLADSASPQTLDRLIDEVTIRETFFFRNRSELDAIDWHSMLTAARARGSREVRVWVAGCASGEEAYTLAILACEAFASSPPPVRLLATDIAPAALAQASAGRYGKRAVRGIEPAVRERYFTAADGSWSVHARLRGLVEFRRHNLVRDPIPPLGAAPFDLVVCRNVLIYFDRATIERVLSSLERALVPAGLLLLGAADRLSRYSPSGHTRRPMSAPRELKRPPRARRPGGAILVPPRDVAGNGRPRPGASAPPSPAPAAPATAPDVSGRDTSPSVARASEAADRGQLDLAVGISEQLLARDPLDVDALYIRGSVELARDRPSAAVEPLRRALYIDPNLAPAAFKLARAYDRLGDTAAACRAYERTLRAMDNRARSGTATADHLDLLDIASACRGRLAALLGHG